MKILAGNLRADSGQMFLEGRPYAPANPAEAIRAGIAMIYQELDLAEHLTVAENIFLGQERTASRWKFRLDNNAMTQETQELISRFGFPLTADAVIGDLSVAQAQMVEILKALHQNAKILVMDEPTSALSQTEAAQLFTIIHRFREEGLAIIYISHRMEEIMDLADEVSVLRDGEMVWHAPIGDCTVETIIRHMVGRELVDFYPKRNAKIGDVLFAVENLCDHEKIADVSFQVRRGEVVGLGGLVGAGRTEVANAIFGVSKHISGRITMQGKDLKIHSPADAIRARIAYLTEDRKRTGLCTALPCSWNITLPNLDHIGMARILSLKKELEQSRKEGERVHVRWASPEDAADTLSGGNQQKLLLARWLMAESDFLIFDEPTRGIDVGAKKDIYLLLNELAEAGKGLLVISSELPELFGVCDRILVMREGRLTANLQTKDTTPEDVMRHATI
jgi:ABC-type sugar transport system ATPase subunit